MATSDDEWTIKSEGKRQEGQGIYALLVCSKKLFRTCKGDVFLPVSSSVAGPALRSVTAEKGALR